MLPLDSENRKLQAFLSSAAATTNPTVTVSFYDVPNQTKADTSDYRRAPQFTVLSGTTETDICAAPKQGTVRHIETLNVYNADTASVTVTICIDDNGTNRILRKSVLTAGQSLDWSKEYGWVVSSNNSTGVTLLAASAVAVSGAADTNENTLATITIPGGTMGANGTLRVSTTWSTTKSVNNKTLRIRLGGISGTQFMAVVATTTVAFNAIRLISNVNSESSQKGSMPIGSASFDGSTGSLPTGSIDTSIDQTLVITGQKASAGETLTLERYSVELMKV